MSCENCTLNITTQFQEEISAFSQSSNCIIVVLVSIAFIVGLFKLLKIIGRILAPLSWIPHDLFKRYASDKQKTWALVTGGSEGIGLAFAEQLAKRNFNIILMSRSLQKLKQAQLSISKSNPNISVKYFSIDFEKQLTSSQFSQVDNLIKDYDISILVNNVGIYQTQKFGQIPYEKIKRQAVVNILPVTILMRMILPKMIERGRKYSKRSGIINISSGASQSQLAYCANYCATKAYINMLTSSVKQQYRHQPIDFLTVKPYLVTSTMTMGQKSILHVSPQQCAVGALRDLGKYSVSYGHVKHRIQGVLVSQLNGKIVNAILCVVNKNLADKYKQLRKKSE